MEILGVVIVFVVIVVFFTGFAFGNWFPVLKPFLTDDEPVAEESKDEDQAAEEQTAPAAAAPVEEVDATPQAAHPARPAHPGLVEVLRVFRDEHNYKLAVEIENELVRREQPFDADQHSRISLIALDLSNWLGLEFDIPKRETPHISLPPKPVADEADVSDEPVRVSFNPVKVVNAAMKANATLPPESRDIAGEINTILHEQLEGTPLETRGIEITQMAGRGLRFVVGLSTYEFLDEIEDADVQQAIREAIRVWEQADADR